MQLPGVIAKLDRKRVLVQTHTRQPHSIRGDHADLKEVVGHKDDTTVHSEVVGDFRFRIEE